MIYDHAFGRQEHTGYRCGVLQCYTGYLGGIDNTGFEQVLEFVQTGVVTEISLAAAYFVYYYGAFLACVGYDLAKRFLDGAADDLYTRLLVLVVAFQTFQSRLGADIHYAAARYDTFFYGCAGCAQSVVNAVFLLFHLYLAGCAYVQLRYAAG